MSAIHTLARHSRAVLAVAALLLPVAACGDDDEGLGVEGTYVHAEEGTIEIETGGEGSITQSGEPVPFEWEQDGDTIQFSVEGAGVAEATLDGDELTFRAGDFSGDEPVTFVRE